MNICKVVGKLLSDYLPSTTFHQWQAFPLTNNSISKRSHSIDSCRRINSIRLSSSVVVLTFNRGDAVYIFRITPCGGVMDYHYIPLSKIDPLLFLSHFVRYWMVFGNWGNWNISGIVVTISEILSIWNVHSLFTVGLNTKKNSVCICGTLVLETWVCFQKIRKSFLLW